MPFEVPQVIGSGSVQELICQTVHFHELVEEVKEIRKTVIIDNCKVVFDKVIIDGRLRKDIMFKKADKGFLLPGNTQGCVGTVATISGPIHDIDLDISFNALIPVPGARPGDECVILQAFVEGEKEEAADLQHTGAFKALIDKSIVFICAKVVRDVITNDFPPTTTGVQTTNAFGQVNGFGQVSGFQNCQNENVLCPNRPSTGFFPGGHGHIPPARRGLVQGTWIGPTLIFPGVLNPGIPTTLPLPNPIVSGQASIVQIAHPGFSTAQNVGVAGNGTVAGTVTTTGL